MLTKKFEAQAGSIGVVFAACLIAVFIPEISFARDLPSAAQSYTSTLKTIAQAVSVAGVIAGGLLMQFPGAAGFGSSVLKGGCVGAVCAFGAPAFQSFLTSVFGG